MRPPAIKVSGLNVVAGKSVGLRCPSCRQNGTFDLIGDDLRNGDGSILGQRVCPNDQCKAHVFVILRGGAVESYPPELIEFDSSDVPQAVAETLEEAIACNAYGCFRASAKMVRRTLEALCADLGATGNDLKARIANLRSRIVLPNNLLEGLDHLRLMGNDAAHIEARTYEAIGPPELAVAIDFTKEVLKAAYQYASLLARLKDMQKPSG